MPKIYRHVKSPYPKYKSLGELESVLCSEFSLTFDIWGCECTVASYSATTRQEFEKLGRPLPYTVQGESTHAAWKQAVLDTCKILEQCLY